MDLFAFIPEISEILYYTYGTRTYIMFDTDALYRSLATIYLVYSEMGYLKEYKVKVFLSYYNYVKYAKKKLYVLLKRQKCSRGHWIKITTFARLLSSILSRNT